MKRGMIISVLATLVAALFSGQERVSALTSLQTVRQASAVNAA